MTLQLARLELALLPEMAAWLPAHRTLVVSDLHLGKSATFRARGIPVPEGETTADLARLEALVERTDAQHVLVAGDLVHAADGLAPAVTGALRRFLDRCPAPLTLVEGNHDRQARLGDLGLPMKILPRLEIDGVTIIHDPSDLATPGPAVCGHLHPSVLLPESPRRHTRVPCFYLHGGLLALPGFGSFTGTHPVRIHPGDRVFVPLRDSVRELPVPKTRG
jgi:DNA ligase-associated metallophosphoesterase